MKWNSRRELPLLVLVALGFVVALAAWPNAAAQVPTHWNLEGKVDGWASRSVGLLSMPAVMALVYLVLTFIPRLDPLRANYARFAGSYTVARALVLLVLVAVQVVIAAAATGHAVRMDGVLHFSIGILFLGLGTILPRFEPNWFAGIRTPWTLSSEEVWHRTHHVGGPVFIVMGLAVCAASFVSGSMAFGVIGAAAAVASLGLVAYSYFVWRQIQHAG